MLRTEIKSRSFCKKTRQINSRKRELTVILEDGGVLGHHCVAIVCGAQRQQEEQPRFHVHGARTSPKITRIHSTTRILFRRSGAWSCRSVSLRWRTNDDVLIPKLAASAAEEESKKHENERKEWKKKRRQECNCRPKENNGVFACEFEKQVV